MAKRSRGTSVDGYVTFSRGDEEVEAHVSGYVVVERASHDSPGDCDINLERVEVDGEAVNPNDLAADEYDAAVEALGEAYADGGWDDDGDDYEPDSEPDYDSAGEW